MTYYYVTIDAGDATGAFRLVFASMEEALDHVHVVKRRYPDAYTEIEERS